MSDGDRIEPTIGETQTVTLTDPEPRDRDMPTFSALPAHPTLKAAPAHEPVRAYPDAPEVRRGQGTCATCRWWACPVEPGPVRNPKYTADCRALPPMSSGSMWLARWVRTTQYHWCAAYEPAFDTPSHIERHAGRWHGKSLKAMEDDHDEE